MQKDDFDLLRENLKNCALTADGTQIVETNLTQAEKHALDTEKFEAQ